MTHHQYVSRYTYCPFSVKFRSPFLLSVPIHRTPIALIWSTLCFHILRHVWIIPIAFFNWTITLLSLWFLLVWSTFCYNCAFGFSMGSGGRWVLHVALVSVLSRSNLMYTRQLACVTHTFNGFWLGSLNVGILLCS